MAAQSLHTVGALGIVRNSAGQVLLVQTASAGWELPGGRVEVGEDVLTALEREVLEETGCTVAVERLAGMNSHLDEPASLLLVFHCRYLAGEPRPGQEELAAAWFTPREALDAVIHASERLRLEDGLHGAGVKYRALRRPGAPAGPGAFLQVHSAEIAG